MNDAELKIRKARTLLQTRSPFFAFLSNHLKLVEVNEEIKAKLGGLWQDSMGVDTLGNLYYSPEWVLALEDNTLKTIICHEVLHVALEHLSRGKNKQQKIFNYAIDLAANDLLLSNNFSFNNASGGRIEGLLPDHNHCFVDAKANVCVEKINEKTAEQIYVELLRQSPEDQEGGAMSELSPNHMYGEEKSGDGNDGEDKDSEGKSDTPGMSEEKRDWKKILMDAAVMAKLQGKLPNGMERYLEGIYESKLSWQQLLQKYVISSIPVDYTYSRQSKRSQSIGVYMPDTVKEMVEIVTSIDTSGSIGKEEMSEYMSELSAICGAFPIIKMTVIACDCEVTNVYELNNATTEELISLKLTGGGGTSHIPVYRWVQENIPDCKLLINFTDGYTSFPETMTVPTLWVLTSNGCDEKNIPFGEVIKIER